MMIFLFMLNKPKPTQGDPFLRLCSFRQVCFPASGWRIPRHHAAPVFSWSKNNYGNPPAKFPGACAASGEKRGTSISSFGFQLASTVVSIEPMSEEDGRTDQIHIEQIEVFAHIGVPDDERSAPQRLTFSMTLWPKRDAAELDDQITKAVNYAEVCAETKKFVAVRRDKLIETLAHALAMHLLEVFEIRRIAVELRKYILPDVEFVSVTVTREK